MTLLFSLFFTTTLCASAHSLPLGYDSKLHKDPVSIQLKWRHSFQFAGYYAAIEKGFYAQEGLDVTLKEVNHQVMLTKEERDWLLKNSMAICYL